MRHTTKATILMLASCLCQGCGGANSASRTEGNPTATATAASSGPVDGSGQGAEGDLADPTQMVGKPAPAFQTKRLDGSDFALKETRGKVVLLDFWATWCGPCVAELPILMKLADEFADRGVVLFAVNQGEASEEIQAFLQEKKWGLNVLLDQDQGVARQYAVEGIPQLLLIDANGVVRKVELGYHPEAEQLLRRELETLVAQPREAPPASS